MRLDIRPGDVRDPRLVAMLEAHSRDMYATSPPESVHTLDLDALATPNVIVLTAWETDPNDMAGGQRPDARARADLSRGTGHDVGGDHCDDGTLLGCGAVKIAEVDGELCGEIKSMRTDPAARGRGVASMVLDALITAARDAGATRVVLETGPQEFFAPARALYARHGFVECGPFGDYPPDPYSSFMTRAL